MHMNLGAAVELARGVVKGSATFNDIDIVLAPPFTALSTVGAAIAGSSVRLGAQDHDSHSPTFWPE